MGSYEYTKLAVFFPGIGYHSDKPLLYYSSKIAQELGYDIIQVAYNTWYENEKNGFII